MKSFWIIIFTSFTLSLTGQTFQPIYRPDTSFWIPVHKEQKINDLVRFDTEYEKIEINKDLKYFSNKREFSFNSTGLISLFTPFNFGPNTKRNYGLITKFYGKKAAFRMGLGADFESDFNDNSGDFILLSLGFERRKPVWSRFSYITGWSGLIDIDVNDEVAFLGAENLQGLEFNINKYVCMGIEAYLRAGIDPDEGIAFKLVAPRSLFVTLRL